MNWKPRRLTLIPKWKEGAIKVYDGQEVRWAIEEPEKCPNRADGEHFWKTDCSYGPEFCERCGQGRT